MQPILLASSSIYRRDILAKLNLNFSWASPDIDETSRPNETANALVRRLSKAKAKALAPKHPKTLIIGSDQVAVLDGKIIGKPHSHDQAFKQLRAASGRKLIFKTGLCLFNSDSGSTQLAVENFHVYFKTLSDEQIENYLRAEQPYDCAGSFKAEGLGISLFSKLKGNDPNALIGLPLIRLVGMLNREGIDPLLPHNPH